MTHEEFNLTLIYTYPASAERVFLAWTHPEALHAWFRPNEQMQTVHVETDLRTGGDYRIGLEKNRRQVLLGKRPSYHEINEPVKLAFTLRWGDETEAEDTYVSITLRQLSPNQTELTLFHDEFLTAAERDSYKENWIGVLAQLGVYLG